MWNRRRKAPAIQTRASHLGAGVLCALLVVAAASGESAKDSKTITEGTGPSPGAIQARPANADSIPPLPELNPAGIGASPGLTPGELEKLGQPRSEPSFRKEQESPPPPPGEPQQLTAEERAKFAALDPIWSSLPALAPVSPTFLLANPASAPAQPAGRSENGPSNPEVRR